MKLFHLLAMTHIVTQTFCLADSIDDSRDDSTDDATYHIWLFICLQPKFHVGYKDIIEYVDQKQKMSAKKAQQALGPIISTPVVIKFSFYGIFAFSLLKDLLQKWGKICKNW